MPDVASSRPWRIVWAMYGAAGHRDVDGDTSLAARLVAALAATGREQRQTGEHDDGPAHGVRLQALRAEIRAADDVGRGDLRDGALGDCAAGCEHDHAVGDGRTSLRLCSTSSRATPRARMRSTTSARRSSSSAPAPAASSSTSRTSRLGRKCGRKRDEAALRARQLRRRRVAPALEPDERERLESRGLARRAPRRASWE